MKIKQICFKFISVIMVFAIMLSTCAVTVMGATANAGSTEESSEEKTDFNYVSLGASNVNGYGLRGYVPEGVYDTPLEKEKQNIYGYKVDTPYSYPVLIAEKLSENYNVNLLQMAMSSMRAEEIRFLLDESYTGDKYTKWRFYDPTTEEVSYRKNWFYGAGRLEWNMMGKEGEPTNTQALATLREAYVTAVTEADLITVDIGMNNFGVYISNQIGSKSESSPEGYYGNDINKLDPEIAEKYAQGKEFVLGVIDEYMGDTDIPMEALEDIADTLAYALVSFCINFDAVMERIYALNPDVSIVVVSIQNLMAGFDAEVTGIDAQIPFGEIFGAVVNAANTYTAVLSPYANAYSYANVSESGHIELFADEVKHYNGDPSTLSQNMKDCFDAYDNEIFLKTRIQQILAVQLAEIEVEAGVPLINIDSSQTDLTDLDGVGFLMFYNGYHYDMNPYMNVSAPVIALYDGTPLKDFLLTDRGNIPEDLRFICDTYNQMLNIAYDVGTEIMREGAQVEVLDFNYIDSGIGDAFLMAMFSTIVEALTEGTGNPDYNFDIYEKYPDGFLNYVSEISGKSIEQVSTAVALDVRGGIGNSFFAHPNLQGHVLLCDAIWNAYVNGVNGKEVVLDNLTSVAGAVLDYIDAHPELMDKVDSLIEQAREYDKFIYENYSRIDVELPEGSSFVAIGGMDVSDKYEHYATMVANHFDLQAEILTEANLRISDLRAIVDSDYLSDEYGKALLGGIDTEAYLNAIKGADVISLGLGVENFAGFVCEQIFGYVYEKYGEDADKIVEEFDLKFAEYKAYDMDWDSFGDIISEEQAEQIREELYSILVKYGVPTALDVYGGLEIDLADIISFAVGCCAYAVVSYVYNFDATIDAIRALNPDATVIMLGSFNVIDGYGFEIGDYGFNLGELMNLLVAAIDLNTVSYVKDHENIYYVYAADTETFAEFDEVLSAFDFIEIDRDTDRIDLNKAAFAPSYSGHVYIATQIARAIDPDFSEFKPCDHIYNGCEDDICIRCGLYREAGEHEYSDCDDTICNKCSFVREAEEHAYSDCTDATCYKCSFVREAGVHTYDGCLDTECNKCGASRMGGHTYENSCADKCLICGQTREIQHSFGEWVVTEAATNQKDGMKERTCTACGASETEVIAKLGKITAGETVGIVVGSALVSGAGGFSVFWFAIKKKTFADLIGVFKSLKKTQ